MQLVPVSGQLNCTQWRKLNAYDIFKQTTPYCSGSKQCFQTQQKNLIFFCFFTAEEKTDLKSLLRKSLRENMLKQKLAQQKEGIKEGNRNNAR